MLRQVRYAMLVTNGMVRRFRFRRHSGTIAKVDQPGHTPALPINRLLEPESASQAQTCQRAFRVCDPGDLCEAQNNA
jgi:hypothetical protein